MIGLLPIALLAAAAPAPAESDAAGNHIEAFAALPLPAGTPQEDDGLTFAEHCTADKHWCARLVRDVDRGIFVLYAYDGTEPAEGRSTWVCELVDDQYDYTYAIWPRIVRLAAAPEQPEEQAALIGVEKRIATGYSGGGASAERLELIRVVESDFPVSRSVLDVPLAGSATIRACFSEADMKRRREACHDEYALHATLALGPPDGRVPSFVFTTKATSYPGKRLRYNDSTKEPALAKADLVKVADPVCSYRRTVRFNPATGRYEFDRPGPDCSDYTVP